MSEYRIEIQITADNGDIWQTIHTEHINTNEPAMTIAEDTAQNQDITDGDDWRIRIYLADEGIHIAEAGPMAECMGLTELGNRILGLASLPPVARADQAAKLADAAKATLARIRGASVYEATRIMPWAGIAEALGISTAAVNQVVTAHRSRATG